MIKLQFITAAMLLLALAIHAPAQDKAEPTQAQAIAAIKKLGGRVTLDEKKPGKPVISVNLDFTNVTDAGLVHVKGLTDLQKLLLINTNVTDAGLVHLKGLTELQVLDLRFTNVTAAGGKKLQAELPKCKILR